jgi:hypothetical protein
MHTPISSKVGSVCIFGGEKISTCDRESEHKNPILGIWYLCKENKNADEIPIAPMINVVSE